MDFEVKGDGLDRLIEMLSQDEMQRRTMEFFGEVMPVVTQEANNLLQSPLIEGQATWQMNGTDSASVVARVKSAVIGLAIGVKKITLIPKRGGQPIVLAAKGQEPSDQDQPSILQQAWDSETVKQKRATALGRVFQLRRE